MEVEKKEGRMKGWRMREATREGGRALSSMKRHGGEGETRKGGERRKGRRVGGERIWGMREGKMDKEWGRRGRGRKEKCKER